jgi:hypothetical protein
MPVADVVINRETRRIAGIDAYRTPRWETRELMDPAFIESSVIDRQISADVGKTRHLPTPTNATTRHC